MALLGSYKAVMVTCYLLVCIDGATVEVPSLKPSVYADLGDLNVGYLTGFYGSSRGGATVGLCNSRLLSANTLQMVESVVYATKEVNSRDDLLPNITLGFVIQNDCNQDLVALARSMRFIPNLDQYNPVVPNVCNHVTSISMGYLQEQCDMYQENMNSSSSYDIVGVIGPLSSRSSVMVASLMSIFQIPVVSTFASSDDLYDTSRYPYFLSLVPPDASLAEAIVDFLLNYNWTYVSLVYSEGSYGENGARQVLHLLHNTEICVAFEQRISSIAEEDQFSRVVTNLNKTRNARAVIVFLSNSDSDQLLSMVEEKGLGSVFFWIGTLSSRIREVGQVLDGAIQLSFPMGFPDPNYEKYYTNLNMRNNLKNPWMEEVWGLLFHCTWAPVNASLENDCLQYINESMPDTMKVSQFSSKAIDGVMLYAKALDSLIREKCPDAFQNKSILSSCIKGTAVLDALKNTSFQGLTDWIEFDQSGKMLGRYNIYQISVDNGDLSSNHVGSWEKKNGLNIKADAEFKWKKTNSLSDPDYDTTVPPSICSFPCKAKEYYIKLELPCCWNCGTCRSNEIIVNETKCVECPLYSWPDEETIMECHVIPPYYLQTTDTLFIAVACIAVLGLLLAGSVGVFFIVKREEKLIKASSKDLSGIILFGVILAFINVIPLLAPTTGPKCKISRILFHVSVCIIYSTLLVKTVRVYRIFQSAQKSKKTPRFVGKTSQIILAIFLIGIQVLISILFATMLPPTPKLQMPNPTLPFVELYCDWSVMSMLIPLVYNMILLILCTVFGFLTRKLPENFNESWYIFLSVSTTFILWLAFLPAYFTTFYGHYREVLLSACLILNAFVTIFCLYIPKVYAVIFIEDAKIKFVTTMGASTSVHGRTMSTSMARNSVAPSSGQHSGLSPIA